MMKREGVHALFLYAYECTFVPKNLDRLSGHSDINLFERSIVCVCMSVGAEHSVCQKNKTTNVRDFIS